MEGILYSKSQVNNDELIFANVYGPNEDDLNFFQDFTKQIDSLNSDLKIIGGDFNFYLAPEDKSGGLPNIHTQNWQI